MLEFAFHVNENANLCKCTLSELYIGYKGEFLTVEPYMVML